MLLCMEFLFFCHVIWPFNRRWSHKPGENNPEVRDWTVFSMSFILSMIRCDVSSSHQDWGILARAGTVKLSSQVIPIQEINRVSVSKAGSLAPNSFSNTRLKIKKNKKTLQTCFDCKTWDSPMLTVQYKLGFISFQHLHMGIVNDLSLSWHKDELRSN